MSSALQSRNVVRWLILAEMLSSMQEESFYKCWLALSVIPAAVSQVGSWQRLQQPNSSPQVTPFVERALCLIVLIHSIWGLQAKCEFGEEVDPICFESLGSFFIPECKWLEHLLCQLWQPDSEMPIKQRGRKREGSEQHKGDCFLDSWFGLALYHLPPWSLQFLHEPAQGSSAGVDRLLCTAQAGEECSRKELCSL